MRIIIIRSVGGRSQIIPIILISFKYSFQFLLNSHSYFFQSDLVEGLSEVVDNVVDMLCTDGETDG